MSQQREIREGTREQGVADEITYSLTFPASWGVPTGTAEVIGYAVDEVTKGLTDVTNTIFPSGTPVTTGQTVVLPECKSLTLNVLYKIVVKTAMVNGNKRSAYGFVRCRL